MVEIIIGSKVKVLARVGGRFNRRGRIDELDHFLLRRAVGRATITYAELVAGAKVAGAT